MSSESSVVHNKDVTPSSVASTEEHIDDTTTPPPKGLKFVLTIFSLLVAVLLAALDLTAYVNPLDEVSAISDPD